MKLYRAGFSAFIGREIGGLLGVPPHVRQAAINVVAGSKQDALVVLAACHVTRPPASDPEFRWVREFNFSDYERVLASAGLFEERGVVVMPTCGGTENNVVACRPGEAPRVVGVIEGWGTERRFIPAEEEG